MKKIPKIICTEITRILIGSFKLYLFTTTNMTHIIIKLENIMNGICISCYLILQYYNTNYSSQFTIRVIAENNDVTLTLD